MSRPFTNITLNEGYTDLFTFDIDITGFEVEKGVATFVPPENEVAVSNSLLFQLKFNGTGDPIPADYRAVFTLNPVAGLNFEYTHYPNSEGYVKLDTGVLPIAAISATKVIDLKVEGNVTQRRDESYLRVGNTGSFKYTLITDLVIDNGFLCVYDNIDTYHRIHPNIEVAAGTTALLFTSGGGVYKYNSGTHSWSSLGTLTFYQFLTPGSLTKVTDGFYSNEEELAGTEMPGTLGVTAGFTNFSLRLQNPDHFKIDLNLKIYKPGSGTSIHDKSFVELEPGSLKINIVNDVPVQTAPADNSPQLSEIEAPDVANTTFSVSFKTFLTNKGLTRLKTLQQAGPIHYYASFPPDLLDGSGNPVAEVKLLQSHVDLYTINPNIVQNQFLITSAYDSLYDIATTPKDEFVTDVEGNAGFTLLSAAQLHEVAAQGLKLFSTVLTGELTESRRSAGTSSGPSNSTFGARISVSSSNSCSCDDCQSNISPFAYLMDLLDYGSKKIRHNPSYTTTDITNFISNVSTRFLQPFGTFKVDCETLHEEFCRTRLVTEILEQAASGVSGSKLTELNADRNNFLWLVYNTILTQAGTSVIAIRDVINIQDVNEKIAAAKKISDRLGIPLYYPTTSTSISDLTVTKLWLVLTGTATLTAPNLQTLFGFRKTTPFSMASIGISNYETWQADYLKELWKKEDYYLSAYSREDINYTSGTTITASIKSTWKPIIDPDIMGWDDMTHNASAIVGNLYKHRKADTDNFLDFYLNDTTVVSATSADINGRILKVVDRDLLSHKFENDTVWIENGAGNWNNPYTVSSKSVNQTDTDIKLLKSTPALSQTALVQPYLATVSSIPKLRYRRVLSVTNISIATSSPYNVVITWTDPVISDRLSGGYIKLMSDDGTTITSYTASTSPSLSYSSSTANSINLVLSAAPAANFTAVGRIISFVYEVEVPLYTTRLVDPQKLATKLLSTSNTDRWNYPIYAPTQAFSASPFPFFVWDGTNINWYGITPTNAFDKLKVLHQLIKEGKATTNQLSICSTWLHMSTEEFAAMMEVLIAVENYQKSMYTSPRPSSQELFLAVSIIRNSAKQVTTYTALLINEEIQHISAASGSVMAKLMLKAQNFWKPITEPKVGTWDSSLQPTVTSTIPLIDPELLDRREILSNPQAKIYLTLYDARRQDLDNNLTMFRSYQTLSPWSTYGVNLFTNVLNYIYGGTSTTSFSGALAPYASLQDLADNLNSTVQFKKLKASQFIWDLFRLNEEDFVFLFTTKTAFESANTSDQPTAIELDKAFKIAVSAYKRKRLYNSASGSWILDEVNGANFTYNSVAYTLPAVKYYNVIKMRLAPGRVLGTDRREWQKTLEAWNRRPFIHPDYVPSENIKNFISGNWIYTTWSARKTALDSAYSALFAKLTPSTNTNANLFTAFKEQLNLLLSRKIDATFTHLGNFDYLPYFTDLAIKETNGEDIRPYLEQLSINVKEYRLLARIYSMLEALNTSNASSTPTLLVSEKDDVVNIMLHIRSHYERFDQVLEEYKTPSNVSPASTTIALSSEWFQNYRPKTINFPISTDIPVYNPWRSPLIYRKEWKDNLEARLDREKAVKDKWKAVIEDADDRNMHVMRDALIKSLTGSCESKEEAAERLAGKYFIETKDNCCVKHTRISFAIETLQGFFFALKNGIYDSSLSGYSLGAPYFNAEWKWLGSYASWRAAVFTFIYPENLLHPLLRKRQSSGFSQLAEKLERSNRFSPEDACQAAKEFQIYYDDIRNIEIVCSTTSYASIYKNNANACCEDLLQGTYRTFCFGQSRITGKTYWTSVDSPYLDRGTDTIEFWEELPEVPTKAKMISCYGMIDRDKAWRIEATHLYLFYSFEDKGKLAMAYLKKDMANPNNEWVAHEMPELPFIDWYGPPFHVTGCQMTSASDPPTFVFSHHASDTTRHVSREYYPNQNAFDDLKGVHYWFEEAEKEMPVAAARFTLPAVLVAGTSFTNTSLNYDVPVIAVAFPTYIEVKPMRYYWDYNYAASHIVRTGVYKKILGLFKSNDEQNTLVVVYENLSGQICLHRLVLNRIGMWQDESVALLNTSSESYTVLTGTLKNAEKIYPSYIMEPGIGGHHVAKAYEGEVVSTVIKTATQSLTRVYNLVPKQTGAIPIQSADCMNTATNTILTRKEDVRKVVMDNLQTGQGGMSLNAVKKSLAVKELIYEAYYFVPLLLALDQQKRGQYPAALSWYRTVYDYTNHASTTNRKIFYGLRIEETITSTYDHYEGWLIDPLNPHMVAITRKNAYSKYTLMNIIQCLYAYADREFTLDTIETVPNARKLYTVALDLLKVNELRTKSAECQNLADACIDSMVEMSNARAWPNHYEKLKEKLASIGNKTLMEAARTDIQGYFNGSTEANRAAKFAAAFDRINTALASAVVSPDDVATTMVGAQQRIRDGYNYVFSQQDATAFYTQVSGKYTSEIVELLGLEEETDLNSGNAQARMQWLKVPLPDSSQDLVFEFTDGSGTQFFEGRRAYNPVNPDSLSRTANAEASNPGLSMAARGANGEGPAGYVPLIDYKFCLPDNPVYKSLQLKGNLELYKIHNCRNIAGMVRELSVYAAATDSTTGMPVIGAGGTLTLPGIGVLTPSQYRFKVLIERAKQIAEQAKQMESVFFAVMEKEDSENYSQLIGRQGIETARAQVKLQDYRVTQANSERSLADLQLDKVSFMEEHFSTLISEGLIGFEKDSLDSLNNGMEWLNASIEAIERAKEIYADQELIYKIQAGVAAGAAVAAGAQGNVSGALQLAQAGIGYGISAMSSAAQRASADGSIKSSKSSYYSSRASYLSQQATYARREQEWQFQKDLAGKDIKIASQQVKIADDNIRIVGQEREIAQLNMDHAKDNYEFIKNKFTNAALYNWMGNVMERCYSFMLNLSTSVARTAESQLYFERQEQSGPFILNDYWETPTSGSTSNSSRTVDRRGLTGSARLMVDITRLEQHAMDTQKRKLQMSKVISLANNFPSEFQRFRETGVLNFELTNKQFDYDFPGHYLRLINTVKTSVVGLIPVYDGIKATLTTSNISHTVIGGTTFQKMPIKRLELDSVALTSTTNATGMFEMQPMQGELLNPFEGMGIESRWEFKLPQFSNRFDFNNIADVLLTVEYTALDSFQYRYEVLQDLDNSLTFNRAFSFRNDFPDQWFELGEAQASNGSVFGVNFEFKRENFPAGIQNLRLSGSDITVYFVRDDGFTDEIKNVDIMPYATSITGIPGGETAEGILPTTSLMAAIGKSPVAQLKLVFANNITNRDLFSTGKIRDIFILVKCKADLKEYPL